MRGSTCMAARITSAVPSVEALSIRTASQLRAVFIASNESSIPRNWPARLRVQMTIDSSGLAEFMHQSRQFIHRAHESSSLTAFGPGLVERKHLTVQGIEQQMPYTEQTA